MCDLNTMISCVEFAGIEIQVRSIPLLIIGLAGTLAIIVYFMDKYRLSLSRGSDEQ